MLLAQTIEREYRFRLALRMGLPIFALIIAFVFHTFIENSQTLQASFYVESLILLVFSIYFFLYLIYNGFDEKITDDVSKTFTREYLFKYLTKEIKKNEVTTLILISIDNLHDINNQYGMKNGDKVLEATVVWINEYLKGQKIENFPFGHIKGGDFIIGLEGSKESYTTILELMCLKSNEFKVGDIEVKISASVNDTAYSKDLDYLVENLFEIQDERRSLKTKSSQEDISPNDLESAVIDAIDKQHLSIMTQDVFDGESVSFKECFVKLKAPSGKLLFPKNFIKAIKKLGLGVAYDLMVLQKVIDSVSSEDESRYAINISPTSLRNEKFLNRAKELLKSSTTKIMFVLSESEYYSHTNRYNSLLNSLRRNGVMIAIDRVASIHTSFLYLRELEIDLIRFDTYYSSATKLEQNRAIVEGFIHMAEEKSVKTWIKKIENSETLALVKRMNIDFVQGKELSDLELMYEN